MSHLFSLSSYDYVLPEDQIAQTPARPADTSKLLLRESDGILRDTVFTMLPDEIPENRVMFLNDSKVIPSRVVLPGAKLITKDGREKVFDGEIFFLEEAKESSFKAMVYPGDYFPVGGTVYFGEVAYRVEELVYEGRILQIIEKDPETSSG